MMRIHGQYDTDGRFITYKKPWDGVVFGDTIRDPSDGFVLALKDDEGWISPTMHKLGLRCPLKVEELPDAKLTSAGEKTIREIAEDPGKALSGLAKELGTEPGALLQQMRDLIKQNSKSTACEKQLTKLLKEAVRIIHANSRNLNKDWLQRARAALAGGEKP